MAGEEKFPHLGEKFPQFANLEENQSTFGENVSSFISLMCSESCDLSVSETGNIAASHTLRFAAANPVQTVMCQPRLQYKLNDINNL